MRFKFQPQNYPRFAKLPNRFCSPYIGSSELQYANALFLKAFDCRGISRTGIYHGEHGHAPNTRLTYMPICDSCYGADLQFSGATTHAVFMSRKVFEEFEKIDREPTTLSATIPRRSRSASVEPPSSSHGTRAMMQQSSISQSHSMNDITKTVQDAVHFDLDRYVPGTCTATISTHATVELVCHRQCFPGCACFAKKQMRDSMRKHSITITGRSAPC